MLDLSIITPSVRPTSLSHYLEYIRRQSISGINFELIIIQESDAGFDEFTKLSYPSFARIIRQKVHHDCGAAARDAAVIGAMGQYIAFWDDDNIYYQHALVSVFLNAINHDVGISRVKHQDRVIPIGAGIVAGGIDTMCLCVKKEVAAKIKWVDNGGRYSDFRWISKIARITSSINYSKVIIGEHL